MTGLIHTEQNGWTIYHENLLNKWRGNAIKFCWCHKETSIRYERYHNIFGILSAICSYITGTVIIGKLSEFAVCTYDNKFENTSFYILIAVGLLSISSGIFSTINTFYKYNEWSEKHKNGAVKWQEYIDKIDAEVSFVRQQRTDGKSFMISIQKNYSELIDICPNIPKDIEKKFSKVKDTIMEMNKMIIDDTILHIDNNTDDQPDLQDELEKEIRKNEILSKTG